MNMKFRPCIDIHNGQVKQIIGSSLCDTGNVAQENFVSEQDAAFYAKLYKKYQLTGGHIIMLNAKNSEYYEDTVKQAVAALHEYKNGLQIGGGITSDNASYFIENGASHVIVTSYVFKDGKVNYENLEKLVKAVGKEKVVLDLSCRKHNDSYYIVTDRWQKFTDERISMDLLDKLAVYCDEFLVHAVDVEGKNNGIELELVKLLGEWKENPITYAGGIKSEMDIELLSRYSNETMDYTIGSALDLFGGTISFKSIMERQKTL